MGQTSDQQSVNLEEGGPGEFRKCGKDIREKNLAQLLFLELHRQGDDKKQNNG